MNTYLHALTIVAQEGHCRVTSIAPSTVAHPIARKILRPVEAGHVGVHGGGHVVECGRGGLVGLMSPAVKLHSSSSPSLTTLTSSSTSVLRRCVSSSLKKCCLNSLISVYTSYILSPKR